MNLSEVIDGLVEELGLEKDKVVSVVCDGVLSAFQRKYPNIQLHAVFNRKIGELEVFAEKQVVNTVNDDDTEISLRRAKTISSSATVGEILKVPFEKKIGRIEILTAKQIIASKIRELEYAAVFNDFKEKVGNIISGIVHKRERDGFAIKMGEVTAFLPKENLIPQDSLRIGQPIRALLKNVLPVAKGDYQIFLDRASADFVKKLIELEIPEVFEGIVEIKKIIRVAGYKTKAIVFSNSKEIDPVGTCVGVGGSRIKPILRELGQEKIDLIEWSDSLESLVKNSLKPAEIDKVEIVGENKAIVWLAQDQRSLAIGKMGQNIMLASKIVGLDIQLQDIVSTETVVDSESEEKE